MSRGIYRGIYAVLFDDDDYHALSPPARLTLLTARQCRQAGPAAIFVCYPTTLAVQTGLTVPELERALDELQAGGWIEREGFVLWIKNGLRYDPNVRMGDGKHRKSVERTLLGLPRMKIVLRFCDYYHLPRPFDEPSRVGSPEYRILDPRVLEPRASGLTPKPSAAPRNGTAASYGAQAWDGYAVAYRARYGVDPIRNAKINGMLARFVQRVPVLEAPQVAAFYVRSQHRLYVSAGHSVDLLLRDAEKLRTEWATGQRMTETRARQSDQTQHIGQMAEDLIRKHSHPDPA